LYTQKDADDKSDIVIIAIILGYVFIICQMNDTNTHALFDKMRSFFPLNLLSWAPTPVNRLLVNCMEHT